MRQFLFKFFIEDLIFLVYFIRKLVFKKNERNNFKKIYIVCVIDGEKSCFNFDLYLEFFVYWVSDYIIELVRFDI